MKQPVVNMKNAKVGEIELPPSVFGEKPNMALLYEAVKMQLTNRRLGTSSTLNCGRVNGSTKKIYKQKGTGRARHGSLKHNIFVGGGVAFGPTPRDYRYEIPRKAQRGALRSALAQKQVEGKMVVIDRWELAEIKTKQVVETLRMLGAENALLVVDAAHEKLSLSVRNLPKVEVVSSQDLSVLDLLTHDRLVVTREAIQKLEQRVSA